LTVNLNDELRNCATPRRRKGRSRPAAASTAVPN